MHHSPIDLYAPAVHVTKFVNNATKFGHGGIGGKLLYSKAIKFLKWLLQNVALGDSLKNKPKVIALFFRRR